MSKLVDRFVKVLLGAFGEKHGMADARQLSEVELGGGHFGSLRFRFMMGERGVFTVFGFSAAPFDRTIAVLDTEDTKRLAAALVDAYREKMRLEGPSG